MGFSVTFRRLPDRGTQRVFQVESMDRPGKFRQRPQVMGADLLTDSPPPGRDKWWPQGTDTKTPGFFQNK